MTRIDQEQLDASVRDGIITPEQAAALKAKAVDQPGQLGHDEERLTVVDNFGDIFIVIGLVMMLSAARAFAAFASPTSDLMIYGGFAAAYWALAEIFIKAKQRRLALTVATALFAYMIFLAIGSLYGQTTLWNALIYRAVIPSLAGLFAALAVAYIRFRPPVLVLFLALTGTALAYQLVKYNWADAPALWVLGGCGLALLITGIIVDAKDTSRSSNWNDAALWLFIVGSPLTIHPLFLSFLWDRLGNYDNLNWTIALACGIALAITLLGIILDRRSLVSSSLIYLSVSLGYGLFKQSTSLSLVAGLIPLTIGASVILLGVFWHPVRQSILRILPLGALRTYLPK